MSELSLTQLSQIAEIDRSATTPLYQQFAEVLRESVLDDTLPPGTRLPPTRDFAEQVGVSCNTIRNAFNQLHSEEYGKTGINANLYQLPGYRTASETGPDSDPKGNLIG